jgi:hypothetical protein
MPGQLGRRTLALDRRSEPTVRETAMFILLGLILVLVVMVAFWPARVARRKGHSFFLFFLLSLVFFPLALVLAYVVDDRSGLIYDAYG